MIGRRVLAVFALMAAGLGATSSSCQFGDSDGSGSGPSFVTDLTLRNASGETSESFDRGERIELVLTVRNRRDTPVTVQFPSARTSDFLVVRENSSSIVWKWSTGRDFAPVETEIDFAAGETRTFRVSWDQTDSNGAQVGAGTYEARGVLVYEGFDSNPLGSHQMASTLERFAIR